MAELNMKEKLDVCIWIAGRYPSNFEEHVHSFLLSPDLGNINDRVMVEAIYKVAEPLKSHESGMLEEL